MSFYKNLILFFHLFASKWPTHPKLSKEKKLTKLNDPHAAPLETNMYVYKYHHSIKISCCKKNMMKWNRTGDLSYLGCGGWNQGKAHTGCRLLSIKETGYVPSRKTELTCSDSATMIGQRRWQKHLVFHVRSIKKLWNYFEKIFVASFCEYLLRYLKGAYTFFFWNSLIV